MVEFEPESANTEKGRPTKAQELLTLLKQEGITGDVTEKPDEKSLEEEGYAEAELKRQELRRSKIENDALETKNTQRKKYAENVFLLMVGWLLAVFAIVIAQGIVPFESYFHLNDSIVLALIGTTTVNIIGLFGIVMKYFFNPKD